MRNVESIFPENIDSRFFMSDIDLKYIDLLQQYINLIRRKMYREASDLLNHSGAFYYGSYIFNMFEKRLSKLETYVVNKEDKKKIGYYQKEKPEMAQKGLFWISQD